MLVAALAVGIFANSLKNEFVYDDWVAIVHNPYLRSWSQAGELLDPTSEYHRTYTLLSYRPLQDLSFLATYQLFGENSSAHHIFNILLHALNALVVVLVLRKLTEDDAVALIGGLAFAVHPVHMQAVQVSGLRADLLATPLFLAALLCHMRLRERPGSSALRWAILAAVSYFLSLSAKEMGATLPLVALFLDLRRDEPRALLSAEGIRPYVGYAVAAGLYSVLRFGLFHNVYEGDPYIGGSIFTALLTTGKIFASYLGHLVLPLHTKPRYIVTPSYGFDASTAGAWALLAALGALAWAARKRHPTLTLGLAWMGLTLIPVANLIPLRNPMADRYLYLPSVGFSAVVGWAAVEGARYLRERFGTAAGRAPYVAAAGLLVLWSGLTWHQNAIWRSERSLWTEVLRLEPENQAVRLSLAESIGRDGRYGEAEEMLREVIRSSPGEAEAYYHLGVVYSMQGRAAEAAELYRKTLALEPSHKGATSRLAALRAQEAGSTEAVEEAREELLSDPTSPQGHYHLGLLYERQGEMVRAKAEYLEAVRLSPEFVKALNNLGIIQAKEGDFAAAEETFLKAVEADPKYARSHFNLANLYLRRREPAKALPHLEEVMRLEPNHPSIDRIRALVEKLRQAR